MVRRGIALLKAMPAALSSSSGNAAVRNLRLLDVAAPEGGGAALDLARWGAALTAGSAADGYTIPAGRTGQFFDGFALLRPAERAVDLARSQEVTLANGGVRAYRVTQQRTLTGLPSGVVAYTFRNVDRQLVPRAVTTGADLEAGEILVLVASTAGASRGVLETR